MEKDKKNNGSPKGETPFQKMERLAKALVTVPKERVQEDKNTTTPS